MGLFNIKCNQAGHICNKSQYDEAKFWEILKLKIHHLYCEVCRKHSKRNATLTQLVKSSKIEILDQQTKEDIQRQFQKELVKHQ
jgi:hypothetical protein